MSKFKVMMIMLVVVLGLQVLSPVPASAQTGANPTYCQRQVGGFLGFPTWYKYLNPRIEVSSDNPQAGPQCVIDFSFSAQKIGAVLLAVFEIITRIAVLVAIVFVIWGGIQLQISQGEPDRFARAQTTIINALIGLAIAVSATAIINFVGNNLR